LPSTPVAAGSGAQTGLPASGGAVSGCVIGLSRRHSLNDGARVLKRP
jgi:hypothetical protein